jgi:hypothetical protein
MLLQVQGSYRTRLAALAIARLLECSTPALADVTLPASLAASAAAQAGTANGVATRAQTRAAAAALAQPAGVPAPLRLLETLLQLMLDEQVMNVHSLSVASVPSFAHHHRMAGTLTCTAGNSPQLPHVPGSISCGNVLPASITLVSGLEHDCACSRLVQGTNLGRGSADDECDGHLK